MEEAAKNNKYVLLVDMAGGDCTTYFKYHGHTINIAQSVIKYKLKKLDYTTVMEELRKGLVAAMRTGDTLVINIGKSVVDFNSEFSNDEHFPAGRVFDCEYWKARDEENYMAVVRPEENYDLNRDKKMYHMREKFQITILH